MKDSIPNRLQAILWSQDVYSLDLEKDKIYIIHQILSHGNIDDIVWLFKKYRKNDILGVFIKHPYKDYAPSRFSFIKKMVLFLKDYPLNPKRYVKNIPRDIR